MLKPTLPLVIVEWLDAWGDATSAITPQDAHLTHHPEIISTLGWVLLETPTGIRVASEFCADGSYRATSFIPSGMIKSVTPFTLRKRHAKPTPSAPSNDGTA